MMTEKGSAPPSKTVPPSKRKENRFLTKVIATVGFTPPGQDTQVELEYKDAKEIGHGSFGMVYVATLCETETLVAIKKVLQDKRYKNRELDIMRKLKHQNIVGLQFFFYSQGDKKDDLYLNLVLEFVPETVYKVSRTYAKNKTILPMLYIKLYIYQMFRALGYIHKLGICHRDIKNLLVNPETGVLKLCDFGSAKMLQRGESNVSYICSRYYRAPELIFGATDYTTTIDVWSGGCVLSELLLGQPLFPGDSGVDQLVEIIKVLGTPSQEQIKLMNPKYLDFKFPVIKAHPWNKVFRPRTPSEAMELTSAILQYDPAKRLTPLAACAHPFFNSLRNPATTMLNHHHLPPLTNFTEQELSGESPSLVEKLRSGGQNEA